MRQRRVWPLRKHLRRRMEGAKGVERREGMERSFEWLEWRFNRCLGCKWSNILPHILCFRHSFSQASSRNHGSEQQCSLWRCLSFTTSCHVPPAWLMRARLCRIKNPGSFVHSKVPNPPRQQVWWSFQSYQIWVTKLTTICFDIVATLRPKRVVLTSYSIFFQKQVFPGAVPPFVSIIFVLCTCKYPTLNIYIYIVVDCVLWIYRFFFLVNHMGFPPTVVAACGRWLAFWRTNDSEWHFPMYISTVIYYIFVFSTTLYYYTQACEVD